MIKNIKYGSIYKALTWVPGIITHKKIEHNYHHHIIISIINIKGWCEVLQRIFLCTSLDDKCHQWGQWAALCPRDSRASRSSAKPTLTMVQQDWSGPIQPACLSQITIMGPESRVHLDMPGKSENVLVDTGTTYSLLTSYRSLLLPNLYHLGGYR